MPIAKDEHEIAYQELVALVNRHASKLSALEVLAIASNMVGKLIALQDQRKTTPEKVMQLVAANIELGNKQAQAQVKSGTTAWTN
jgi:hypothetical protein